MSEGNDYPKQNNPISLERLDERITWVCKNFNDKLEANKTALVIAKESVDRKHLEMNEVREQLQRQAQTFLARDVYERDYNYIKEKLESISEKILTLERLKGNIEGRMITFGFGGLALLVLIQLAFNWLVK